MYRNSVANITTKQQKYANSILNAIIKYGPQQGHTNYVSEQIIQILGKYNPQGDEIREKYSHQRINYDPQGDELHEIIDEVINSCNSKELDKICKSLDQAKSKDDVTKQLERLDSLITLQSSNAPKPK